jgi:hypothetical protein
MRPTPSIATQRRATVVGRHIDGKRHDSGINTTIVPVRCFIPVTLYVFIVFTLGHSWFFA